MVTWVQSTWATQCTINLWIQRIKDYIWGIYNRMAPRLYTRDEVFWEMAWPNRHTHNFGRTYHGICWCKPFKLCNWMNRGCSVRWEWNGIVVSASRWDGKCKEGGGCSCWSEWDLCMQCADETWWQINNHLSASYNNFNNTWGVTSGFPHIYWLY